MLKKKYKIDSVNAGIRLDKFLADNLTDYLSRSAISRLISNHLVTINDRPVKASHILRASEEIILKYELKPPALPQAEDIKLDIIYEDDFLAVVNKPAGMITHPPQAGKKHTLVNALLHRFNNLSDVAGPLKPGIIHRLDKDTSGLLVIAKDNQSHRKIAAQFKQRSVKREYIALVLGVVEFDEGVIDAPLGRSSKSRLKRKVDMNSELDAITRYTVIKRFNKRTLLRLELKTGRTHQIRVHLKHINHPIIGDSYYGVKADAARQMLHAAKLGFLHPNTGEFKLYESDIPAGFKMYLKALEQL
jgi:23S rRNA pseudouridine1911/1915/1917 synthase